MIKIRLIRREDLLEANKLLNNFSNKKIGLNKGSSFTIVAICDGEICGLLKAFVRVNQSTLTKDYYISNLVVAANYQMMGVATELISYLEEKGKQENIKHIYTLVSEKNEDLTKLYNKLNYDLKNISCFRREL